MRSRFYCFVSKFVVTQQKCIRMGFFFMTSQLFLFLKCAIACYVKNNQNFIVFLYEKKTKFLAIKKIKKRGSDGISVAQIMDKIFKYKSVL
jgi:hypothetical protein